jgi:hypothetical protein
VTVAVSNKSLQEVSSSLVLLGGKLNFCMLFTPNHKQSCRICYVPIPFLFVDLATEGQLDTKLLALVQSLSW